MDLAGLEKLIGQKYDKLTVIDAMRKRNSHSTCTYVTCECECGTVKDYQFSAVKLGNIKSCGCANKCNLDELIGQKFGEWTVINAYHKRDNKGRNRIYTLCSYNGEQKEILYNILRKYNNRKRKKLTYNKLDKKLYRIYTGINADAIVNRMQHIIIMVTEELQFAMNG